MDMNQGEKKLWFGGTELLMHGLKVGEKNPEAWPARQWRENTALTLQEL